MNIAVPIHNLGNRFREVFKLCLNSIWFIKRQQTTIFNIVITITHLHALRTDHGFDVQHVKHIRQRVTVRVRRMAKRLSVCGRGFSAQHGTIPSHCKVQTTIQHSTCKSVLFAMRAVSIIILCTCN